MGDVRRDTLAVDGRGSVRERIAAALRAAYGDGLLSQTTLVHRLDVLCASHVIEPAELLGDLSVRAPGSRVRTVVTRAVQRARELWDEPVEPRRVLALDWSGATEELTVGRHARCEVVLEDPTVSRRHVRLLYRDGQWVLQDLESTNGTLVNGARVGRCQLRPGDAVDVGDVRLVVD